MMEFEKFFVNEKVDYAKWQRKSLPSQKVSFDALRTDPRRRPTAGRASSFDEMVPTLTNESKYAGPYRGQAPIPSTPLQPLRRKLESACSTRCRHLTNSKEEAKAKEIKANPEDIQFLQFQIRAKRHCVLECKKQILNLIEENIRLKKSIQGTETTAHGRVKKLLEKYQKIRGAMATISQEHAKQKDFAECSFNEVKQMTESGLANLSERLESLQLAVSKKQDDIKTLNNYKNKEYPEKVIRINQLKKELHTLDEMQMRDLNELSDIVTVEEIKYRKDASDDEFQVIKDTTTHMFEVMDRGVKRTAMQNIVLRKEIEIQKKEKMLLESEIGQLENDLNSILDESSVIKDQRFPGVFLKAQHCLPDSDVELSIPRREFLPL